MRLRFTAEDSCAAFVVVCFVCLMALVPWSSAVARSLTLQQALDRAINETARGEMIRGNLEVAQQYYSARRINMYLPEVSINGSLPSYEISKSYQPFSGPFDKRLFEERTLDFESNIQLKQSLFTGGSLTARANLISQDNRYPDFNYDPSLGLFVNEDYRRGFFDFDLQQPLFRPSSVRHELNNRKDDLEIARMTKLEEEASLNKEVTEAYMSVLQLELKTGMTADKLEKARLQEEVDSCKLVDGVASEEDYLLSTAARLDAELEHFELQTEYDEQRRELNTLLDFDATEALELAEPPVPEHLDEAKTQRLISAWDRTAPIIKAEHEYTKKKREAEYAAAGHGLTGDLHASYSLGRERIEQEFTDYSYDENINTDGWTVSLDFSLPIWDGGAGGAAVKAAQYEAEQAKYEFTRAKRSARAQIMNLINQLNVSYQRLSIISKQIELAAERLEIAKSRYADGQISMLTLLESRVFYLETKDRYLDELKEYLGKRIELQGKFLS